VHVTAAYGRNIPLRSCYGRSKNATQDREFPEIYNSAATGK